MKLDENVIRIIDDVIDEWVNQSDPDDGYREYLETRRVVLKYVWDNYITIENEFFNMYLYLSTKTKTRTYKTVINDILKDELFQKFDEYAKQDFENEQVIDRIKMLYYFLLMYFEQFDQFYGLERRAL